MTWAPNGRDAGRHRTDDPRRLSIYKNQFIVRMKAELPWSCGICGGPIGDIPWPAKASWTWDHDPPISWIQANLPREEWAAAVTNPLGGRPAHKSCNEAKQDRGQPVRAHTTDDDAHCADCGQVPHLHRDRTGHGLTPSMDGVGRSEEW